MKRYMLLLALLIAVSCEKTPEDGSVPVTVTLEYEGKVNPVEGITVNLRDLSGKVGYKALTDADGTAAFNVLPGFYEATASFRTSSEGELLVFNGVKSDIAVSRCTSLQANDNRLNLSMSKTNQIVIKEFYIGGCPKNNGSGSFSNDSYMILYNNSDQPADASKVCFAAINPANAHASNKWLVNGNLMYEPLGYLPAAQAIWWFETDVIIEPWSQKLIAIKGAIDHTATYTYSVDLSQADYAMYDPESGFTNASSYPAPSDKIPESNYLHAFRYSAGNTWTYSLMCPAFVIFRNDDPLALAQNSADYDYTNGEKLPSVKVPVEDVVDGVEVFLIGKEDSSNKRLTSNVDAGYVYHQNQKGYTVYRNVDAEATEAIEGNKEKLVYGYTGGTAEIVGGSTDPSGIDAEASIKNGAKIVYMDTNNSTNDFHLRKVSSLK